MQRRFSTSKNLYRFLSLVIISYVCKYESDKDTFCYRNLITTFTVVNDEIFWACLKIPRHKSQLTCTL